MKNITFFAIIILFGGYILWDQLAQEDSNYTSTMSVLIEENNSLKKEKLELLNKVNRLTAETDSLLQKANCEKQEVVKIKIIRDERIQAVNDFNDRELFDFFTELKTESAQVRE